MTTLALASVRQQVTERRRMSGAASWLLEGIMLASAVAFVKIGNTDTLINVVIVFGIAIVMRQVIVRNLAQRQVIASAAMITLFVTIPINRLPSSGHLLLTVSLVAAAIGISGFVGARLRFPRGSVLLVVLILALTFVTAVSPDTSALLRELPLIVSALPILIIAGQTTVATRIRIARFIVFVAFIQSILSVAEPVYFPDHIWVPAQLDSAGNKVPLENPLLGNRFERSQGTLGHPLALSFVLLVAIALVVRVFPRLTIVPKLVLVGVLLGGLIYSGSRNSLIIAAVILLYFLAGRMTMLRGVVSTLVGAFGVVLAISASWLSKSAQQEFSDSGSVTHRLGAYDSIGKLLTDQLPVHALFGNGYASTGRLFQLQLLQTDGFDVIDNQFIFSLAIGGVLSVLLLVAIVVLAFVRSDPEFRPAVVAVAATMLIFDTYGSPAVTVLSFAIFGIGLNPNGARSWILARTPSQKAVL